MAKVTGFRCFDTEGFPILCDPFGNNVAFRCPGCSGPVLAVLREHQRGSNEGNPSICTACGSKYWIEVNEPNESLILHRIST
jgi:hypothetical protein